MGMKKRPKARGEDGLFGLSNQTIAKYREIANYGDLIDDYFRLVNESLESDEPLEATTDDFLRYAKARRRQERAARPESKRQPKRRGKSAIDARRSTKGDVHD